MEGGRLNFSFKDIFGPFDLDDFKKNLFDEKATEVQQSEHKREGRISCFTNWTIHLIL